MNDIITKKTKASGGGTVETVTIRPPNMQRALFTIKGTSPLVINRPSQKMLEEMMATQAAGQQAKSKKKREPKKFDDLAAAACYQSNQGWYGINASCFRNAMIGACRLVGYKMTLAKLSIFVEEEGRDKFDATPLVRIIGGDYRVDTRPVRNANGSVDLRPRPMWVEWAAKVTIRWDADQFSITDVTNLLARVGEQCGIGEGRASSTMSAGLGWGHFTVEQGE